LRLLLSRKESGSLIFNEISDYSSAGLADIRKALFMKKAIGAYNEALRVRTFDAFPMDYAMTKNNLEIAMKICEGQ
jgi:hypothetical protein